MAKRKVDPYSPATIWYKVKNPVYTQKEGRWELSQRPKRGEPQLRAIYVEGLANARVEQYHAYV